MTEGNDVLDTSLMSSFKKSLFKMMFRCGVERCPQGDPEDQLSHVQPSPHSHLHPSLPGLHWVRLLLQGYI